MVVGLEVRVQPPNVQSTLNMYCSDRLCPCTRSCAPPETRRSLNSVHGGTGRLGSAKHAAEKQELY